MMCLITMHVLSCLYMILRTLVSWLLEQKLVALFPQTTELGLNELMIEAGCLRLSRQR